MIRKLWNALTGSCYSSSFDYEWLQSWFKLFKYNQDQIRKELKAMSQNIDAVNAKVDAVTALLTQLLQAVDTAIAGIDPNDPAKTQVVLDKLTAMSTSMQDELTKLQSATTSPTTTTEAPAGTP